MRIISYNQYPDFTPEREFKETWLSNLISLLAALVLLAAAIVGYRYATVKSIDIICIVTAAICGLWALAAIAGLFSSRRPANWLVRCHTRQIWIKFRSHRNAHLSNDDPQIIELDQKEIVWARRVTVRTTFRNNQNNDELLWIKYLEIGLADAHIKKVSEALWCEERAKPDKWIVKHLDFPVMVTAEGTLRLRWRDPYHWIQPGLNTILDFISQFAEVRPPAKEVAKYTYQALHELPEDQQRIRLAEMARLRPIMAIQLTRELRKCSRAEATAYLEQSP